MAVDSPARIALLGAGPIGLEAALYARYLGYDVQVFERGRVAENVCRWGHVRMFSPFGMNRSTLGLAALAAQDERYAPPGDEALLTGHEWIERYLAPLSQTDLLADHLRTGWTVLAVTRTDCLKQEGPGDGQRADSAFRLLTADHRGQQEEVMADVVIDTTGVYGNPNWMGAGGGPALGEVPRRQNIHYEIPDLFGRDRHRFQGRRILVIGSGHSAATTVVALDQLAAEVASTHVTWVTRRTPATGDAGPLPSRDSDPLAERARLCSAANRCAASERINHWPGTVIHSLALDEAQQMWTVELRGQHAGRIEVDEIVANVGYRPDVELFRELQVHQCYASEGPMKLAARLLAAGSADCLDQPAQGPETLVTSEPNFYVLGSKSYGRNPNFLVATGLEQIRTLFSLIGERQDLDLYASVLGLLKS